MSGPPITCSWERVRHAVQKCLVPGRVNLSTQMGVTPGKLALVARRSGDRRQARGFGATAAPALHLEGCMRVTC